MCHNYQFLSGQGLHNLIQGRVLYAEESAQEVSCVWSSAHIETASSEVATISVVLGYQKGFLSC